MRPQIDLVDFKSVKSIVGYALYNPVKKHKRRI